MHWLHPVTAPVARISTPFSTYGPKREVLESVGRQALGNQFKGVLPWTFEGKGLRELPASDREDSLGAGTMIALVSKDTAYSPWFVRARGKEPSPKHQQVSKTLIGPTAVHSVTGVSGADLCC